MKRVAMHWRVMPTLRRTPVISPFSQTATCLLGLFAVVLFLGGCFFFRSKPDTKVQEMASRLSPGMTTDEVLDLVGPPQRRGQNLFDKKKEYWIYQFVKPQENKKKRSRDTDRNSQETVVESELQLLFERGKLVNWNVVPHKDKE
jgi:outer membrane protein assembly factor BamE (lipoprotein component of BamABCDE complex)